MNQQESLTTSSLPHLAHLEDSTAPAEHLFVADLQQRLKQLQKADYTSKPNKLLERAWFYSEYALATPDTAGDDMLFDLAQNDLSQVLVSDLPIQNQTKFNAAMLLDYQEAFRARANSQPISQEIRKRLQQKLGQRMLAFLDVPDELTADQYGYLSEAVVAAYLLNGDLFPYLASWREEKNMIAEDNHDIYTLHPCHTNRIKKSPISVKYRKLPSKNIDQNYPVVHLAVGKLVVDTANSVPPYNQDPVLKLPEAKSSGQYIVNRHAANCFTRLAADIIICASEGETLSDEDMAFMEGLTKRMETPLMEFAAQSNVQDYASNAQALRREITVRNQTQIDHNRQLAKYSTQK